MVEGFLEDVRVKLRDAARVLGLDEKTVSMLEEPERVVRVKIPVRMDSGEVRVFTGWRSQHNSALGPYKGGIRIHSSVSESEVIALSILMTLKCSLLGLPYGGGKGGIRADPKSLSAGELEKLARGYVRLLADVIGEDLDIPAPDVGVDSRVLSWMVDEYMRVKGRFEPGAFTGKPPELWGLRFREESTGYGVAVVAREAARKILGLPEGSTVAVQGFGNVGYHAAATLSEMGFKVVAVSDSRGGVYSERGLRVDEVARAKRAAGSVVGYREAEVIDNDTLLSLDVDILVLAALEGALNSGNADRVRAKLVVEGANGPVTSEAEKKLLSRRVFIVPDILANGGGVVASYGEWVYNKTGGILSEEEVKSIVENKLKTAFDKTLRFWESELGSGGSLRLSAYAIGVKRVVDAMRLRGWI